MIVSSTSLCRFASQDFILGLRSVLVHEKDLGAIESIAFFRSELSTIEYVGAVAV